MPVCPVSHEECTGHPWTECPIQARSSHARQAISALLEEGSDPWAEPAGSDTQVGGQG